MRRSQILWTESGGGSWPPQPLLARRKDGFRLWRRAADVAWIARTRVAPALPMPAPRGQHGSGTMARRLIDEQEAYASGGATGERSIRRPDRRGGHLRHRRRLSPEQA